ncbi:MAG: hypothetical protein KBT02_07985 [Treponema sp.]|nr:hypothetical protein [Candidatus Treponema caballi]
MKKIVCVLMFGVLIISGLWADIDPKFTGWKQAETDHFTFVYEDASKEAAEAYAKIADEAWNKIAEVYSLPQEKITVFVTGRTNTVNAFTYWGPVINIGMFTTPFLMNDFLFRDDWVKYVFTHELIHAANGSFEGKENPVADIFGNFFRMMDIQQVNGWELEGLTTVLETELSKAGRGRSPYFELNYKAPALEGSLLNYGEIGLEAEPPAGQIYVYGYVMMRSIADRWGLDTLADIERNREVMGSLEDAVLAVTGESAQQIWQEAKTGLVKKYAAERAIPEGKTISPIDSYYYRPAIILDDGTMIVLRSNDNGNDVVSLNPALPSGESLFEELENGEATLKETILFSANSAGDADSVTADMNRNVYASLAITRADRAPGPETEYQIFRWNAEEGLTQLTQGSSYFQPSVSRDGSTLVAIEQKGLHMRLVQIDTETGNVTPLLDDPLYDIGFPAVSADGSKVALLRTGQGRAAVAVFDMKDKSRGVNDASCLTIVANGEGDIVDPAYPTWNEDGSLTYCSNDRGRLEVYEVTDTGDGTFSSTPVVADPVAALWAYKNARGIYYGSYASTGNVIKMKPKQQWGKVPDWNGPSMPGKVITFGDFAEDYNFYPYTNGDKQKFTTRDKAQWVNAENVREPVTELQNEKGFVLKPETLLRLPMVSFVPLPDESLSFGFGGIYLGMTPLMTGRMYVLEADAMFYPTLMNFTGDIGISGELNNSVYDLYVLRQITPVEDDLVEANLLLAGFSTPFYNRSKPLSSLNLSTITNVVGGILRSDDEAFSVTDDVEKKYILKGSAGLSLESESWNAAKTKGLFISSSAVAIAGYDNGEDKMIYGAEADIDLLSGSKDDLAFGFYLQGRYLDAPADFASAASVMKHGGKAVSCENPWNFIGRLEMNCAGLCIYEEALASCAGDGTFSLDDSLTTGAELVVKTGNNSLAAGITANYSLSEQKFSYGGIYCTLKLNFLRM